MNIGACRCGFTGLPFPFVSCAGLNCAEGGRSALTDPLCCHPPSLWRQRCHCCPNGAGNPNTRTESICSGSAGPLLCIERTEPSPSVQERPVGWHPPHRPVYEPQLMRSGGPSIRGPLLAGVKLIWAGVHPARHLSHLALNTVGYTQPNCRGPFYGGLGSAFAHA